MFSVQGHRVNILGFVNHMVFVKTAQLWGRVKVATEDT